MKQIGQIVELMYNLALTSCYVQNLHRKQSIKHGNVKYLKASIKQGIKQKRSRCVQKMCYIKDRHN